ncbi:MAG: hypothetical protein SFX73_34840 [Kofleriaceae bacterium]|nr:hypothetical protein [Kofleriaceae bacterium]
MKRLGLLLAFSLAACGTDSTLTIENDSTYTLTSIQLSPTSSTSWGPDLLGADVLDPGDVLELSNIECDTYDIRVIDDTDAECVLDSVDLCLDDAVWIINDAELVFCGF